MYVYVLEDKNGKQYVGITLDLERRLRVHKKGHTVATSKMDLTTLEVRHYWTVPSYSLASRFERYLHTIHKNIVSDIIIDCPLWCKTLEAAANTKQTTPYENYRDNNHGNSNC